MYRYRWINLNESACLLARLNKRLRLEFVDISMARKLFSNVTRPFYPVSEKSGCQLVNYRRFKLANVVEFDYFVP